MLFKKKNETDTAEAALDNNTETMDAGNHRDAVSPAERAMIAAASGDAARPDVTKTVVAPRVPMTKYDYLNAPIVKSRPCPLCGEFLEADTIFCPKCNNRVVSRYDEALILRRQGKELPKDERKTETVTPKKPENTAPKKLETAAPVRPAAPAPERKPETATPVRPVAPAPKRKPEAAAPVRPAAPVPERKPEAAASVRPAAPAPERKPETAAPVRPAAPERKRVPDDELIINVKGSGYAKHTINPHFTPADDFDD